MLEIEANIWKFHPEFTVVIPTNGTVKKNGACVMGRGLALQAKTRYPYLQFYLGQRILGYGNHVHEFENFNLVSFPVKHNYYEIADLTLIEQSTNELIKNYTRKMYLPEVGCGNGGRSWEEVKPILSKLPDNFTVVHFRW